MTSATATVKLHSQIAGYYDINDAYFVDSLPCLSCMLQHYIVKILFKTVSSLHVICDKEYTNTINFIKCWRKYPFRSDTYSNSPLPQFFCCCFYWGECFSNLCPNKHWFNIVIFGIHINYAGYATSEMRNNISDRLTSLMSSKDVDSPGDHKPTTSYHIMAAIKWADDIYVCNHEYDL